MSHMCFKKLIVKNKLDGNLQVILLPLLLLNSSPAQFKAGLLELAKKWGTRYKGERGEQRIVILKENPYFEVFW